MLFLYAFITIVLINCAYFLLFLSFALSKKKDSATIENLPPISVLVYIKNNVENLESNLNAILEQDYPDFEIILINDSSTDDSFIIIEEFQKNHPNFPIYLTNVHGNEMFWGSKKYALTLGIKRAKNNYLLFTDGHGKPLNNQWIIEKSADCINNKQLDVSSRYYTQD